MLFSKRSILALKAIRWCEEHNVQPTPFNIVTALNHFGALKEEAAEQPRAVDADTWLCKDCNRTSSNFRVNCFWCGHSRQ